MTEDKQQPEWIVSSSPHAHSGDSVRRIMLTVLIALAPALAASIKFFGWNAVRLVTTCVDLLPLKRARGSSWGVILASAISARSYQRYWLSICRRSCRLDGGD